MEIVLNDIEFLSLKIGLITANSEDSDEIPHTMASHLGLHCFPDKKLIFIFSLKTLYMLLIESLNTGCFKKAHIIF